MKQTRKEGDLPILVVLFVVALMLTLATVPLVPTFAQTQGVRADDTPSPASSAPEAATRLPVIVVKGHRIYLPVALQIIKAALKRPVNFRHENLDKLVCQFTELGGTGFQTLDCRTNCQRWIQHEAVMGVLVSNQICASGYGSLPLVSGPGQISAIVGGWADRHPVNRGALMELLKKLPPANSSYTLRVTDHGRVVAEYVFKHGDLVSVRKYIYKREKKK